MTLVRHHFGTEMHRECAHAQSVDELNFGTAWYLSVAAERNGMSTVREIRDRDDGKPITMLTAYDALTASIVEDAGIEIILVGDSMGNTVMGYDSTLPVTVDDIQSRTGAVVRATEETLVIADLPFLSFGVDETETVQTAGQMLKEAGADAVKIECGPHTIALTEQLVELGIPVMAHLGLTPQHINQIGHERQATDSAGAEELLDLAKAHQQAGAFAVVLEHVPSNVATAVTTALDIPTIGIGAGPDCDGQVLVITDVLGLDDWSPSFSKQFGDVRGEIKRAVSQYRDAVDSGEFPGREHSHTASDLDEFQE